jgi:hemin uptake protein HemP
MSTQNSEPPTSRPRPEPPPRPGRTRPLFDLRDLIGDGREAIIKHGGEQYLLRLTSNDKLILTK